MSHLDLNGLLQRMWLLIAGKANSRVKQELVTDGVPQSVILACHDHGALVSLTTVLLIFDLSRSDKVLNSHTSQ
jgi:hypothetical protein